MSLSLDKCSICSYCSTNNNLHYRAHNVNTLLDLRGCAFAYSDKESLSGSKIVLKTLHEKGENASFFGSLISMFVYNILWFTFSYLRLNNGSC